MNNNQIGNNFPQNNMNPPQNVILQPIHPLHHPAPIMRCGVDNLKIRPRPIVLKEAQPKINNQPQINPQPNPNVNMNNNIMPNNFNNNINPNPNNQPNIPHQWKDYY